MPARANGDSKADSRGEQAPKLTKTTKLGMEIESDEDEDDNGVGGREDQKIVKNGSFSSNFLKSRNLFNLRLSTDFGSRLTFDNSTPLPKKSPVTPYSRQTSSSDSQKSANSLQPQTADWESTSPNSLLHRQRRNSISSCYSISEGNAGALEKFTMNQSELIKIEFLRCRGVGRVYSTFLVSPPDFREPIVLGWLEVSINYDESQDSLFCTILRARDLPPMDSAGLSDPFCKVNIITAENTLRHTRWQKSRIAHKTNNPEFV